MIEMLGKTAKVGLLGLVLSAVFSVPANATVIDVSSLGSAGTTASFDAGSYDINFIGSGEGGAYDAWNPWGSGSSGCGSTAGDCGTGWLNSVKIEVGANTSFYYIAAPFPRGGVDAIEAIYGSATDSLNSYKLQFNPIRLTLDSTSNVRFWIQDTYYADNGGGVSLNVTSVPEPSTLALFGIAALGLVYRTRRKLRVG